MSLLERTVFFRQFWLGCYLRTWSACAFTQFKVFAQYQFDLQWLSMSLAEKWQWTWQQAARFSEGLAKVTVADSVTCERDLSSGKKPLPFYLLGQAKLEALARQIGFIFSKTQTDFFTEQALNQTNDKTLSDSDVDDLVVRLYRHLGLLCEAIGLDLHYWKTFSERDGDTNFRPNIKLIEIALNKAVCEKFWFRVLRKAQKQMVEHLAIACGEVRKGVFFRICDLCHRFSLEK